MSDATKAPKKIDLLPCPFCGGAAALVVGAVAFNDYEVQCDGCGFSGPNFGSLGQEPFPREDAIQHWNTRASLDAMLAKAREDALREAAALCAETPSVTGHLLGPCILDMIPTAEGEA